MLALIWATSLDLTVDIDVDGYRSSLTDSHFQNADGGSTRMP